MKFQKIISTLFLTVAFSMLTHAQLQLNGAGATFPAVIYSKWFDQYKNATGVQ